MSASGPRPESRSPPERESPQQRELWLRRRIEQYLDGVLRPEEAAELDRRLREDPQLLQSFLLYLAMHARIAWNARSRRERGGAGSRMEGTQNEGTADNDAGSTMDDAWGDGPAPAAPVPSLQPASFIPHSSSVPSINRPSFFSGVLLSYACATLLLAVSVLAARFWQPAAASQDADAQGTAAQAALPPGQTGPLTDLLGGETVAAAPALPLGSGVKANPVIIGQITGMSDCHWAYPSAAVRIGDPVPLGRKYPLTAGRLEITYNVGAKVIIEGPAIYTTSGGNVGELFLGKLKASAGKFDRAKLIDAARAAGRPAPSGPIVAFCVLTAHAVATDKGDEPAEFSLQVDRSTRLFAHVFRGVITVSRRDFTANYTASAGTFLWTGSAGGHTGLFIYKPGPEAAIFVTQTPKPPPVCLTQPAVNDHGRTTGRSGG